MNSFNDYRVGDGLINYSLDSFYVTDGALSVTNIAELVTLNKVLTDSI